MRAGLFTFSAATSVALGLLASPASAEPGPFAGYAGAWAGSGTITTSSGAERIRCRAVYAVGGEGASLQQNLICASDSYRFEVTSSVRSSGGALSGSWSETTRGAQGSLSGRAADGHFSASVAGPGFSATISVSTSGQRQSVTITPRGTDVSKVSMVLQRS